MKKYLAHTFVGFLLFLGACGYDLPESVEAQLSQVPQKVDYNFHVKPILSDRCFACHGPDAQKREADLRLDLPESAFAALSSGEGYAIKSRSLGQSQLVKRILSLDSALVMPPPSSHLALSEYEKAVLIKWIDQGATYKDHWAFAKPNPKPIPKDLGPWAKNEIDYFIAKKLEQQGIAPSPEADKEQLIRRVYFDVLGLPPTLSELDKWLGDTRPDSHERMVDSLLQLPAFGERMAAHWMDVARFADSEGYLDDFHHEFWPYRDWVIKAFNENLPYDKFILWQVGGDQIPDATQEQVLATAFNRNHKQNSEGGVIPEEFRVDYVADRTQTVGTAFLGLTVGCARCHDHKYDPISQENYYQLFSFFNSTIERGDGIFSENSIEYGQMVTNKHSMNAGPVLALADEKVLQVREMLLQEIQKKEQHLQKAYTANSGAFQAWAKKNRNTNVFSHAIERSTVSHLTFDQMEGGKSVDLTPGAKLPTYWGDIRGEQGKWGGALRSAAQGQFVADGSRSSFERMEPFTISFWLKIPEEFEEAHIVYNGNNRIQGYRGWDVLIDSSLLHFRLNHAHPYQSLDIAYPKALPLQEWMHFVWTYDGTSKAEGMRLFKNGQEVQTEIHRNHIYRSTEPYTDPAATVYMAYKGIVIGNRHYDQDFEGGLLDEFRVLNREAGDLTALYLFNPDQGEKAFLESLDQGSPSTLHFYNHFVDPKMQALREDLQALQIQEIQAIDTVQEIMVMGDYPNQKATYILDRGVYSERGKPVTRDIPQFLSPWPKGLEKNRYGLGKWLTDPDHPLTARVAVNQFWYLMFGRGIVETVEDFGNQGALPTHPELLDWLAVDFQENNWDVKRLIKKMLCSASYRQSSKIRPELQEKDPDNHLLARGPRYRRSAEMVRDNALAVSGLLNPQLGGPSTFPYQPSNLWKEVMTHTFFPEYEVDSAKGLYRRSLYTFWKRNMPPPSMLIFDASYKAECQVRRQRSNTPLQALVLLNDPQVLEACRVLAEKLWHDHQGEVEKACEASFRLLTSREPTKREQELLLAQYQDELSYFRENQNRSEAYLSIGYKANDPELIRPELAALARVNNTILNSTESYFKN